MDVHIVIVIIVVISLAHNYRRQVTAAISTA